MRFQTLCVATVILFLACNSQAQTQAGSAANSDPTYQQLRNISLGSEAVTVSNLDLKRDAATFHLKSGTVCFVTPVQGKVTGAVFRGDGSMTLDPPTPIERASLKLLTKSNEFVEQYEQLVLRFTDSTYEDLKKSGMAGGSCDAGPLRDSQHALRHSRFMKYNLDARILQDVLSTEPGALFAAFVRGKRYDSKELFVIDPHGAFSVAPEEVELITYGENRLGTWAAFHSADEYKNSIATGTQKNAAIQISNQQLDMTIQKNAHLSGKASTSFVSLVAGLRAVPFDLYNTLRVQSVAGDKQQPLSFIQEDKNDDADFWVILPHPLSLGERYTIMTTYDGKDAIESEGGGNYYPIAREDWYPNGVGSAFGQYVTYDMTFRIPKGMNMAATGVLVSETNEGGQNVTVWKSAAPQTVAGFNFGSFKVEEAKLAAPEYLIRAYANDEPPDNVRALLRVAGTLGTMSTVPALKRAVAEAELAVQLYSEFYGPPPYKQLAVTQQWACNYGQSWPGLIYLPICYFYDSTVRRQLGMEFHDFGYWKVVAPHEVAHQWWGHAVGFSSYRDQWMSEGFSDMSASLYIQLVEKNPQRFIDFWNDERTLLVERNNYGFRAIDAGPLTMGYRMSNDRTGFDVTRRLIYPKGAYILHMLRMMMWSNQSGDGLFKEMMHDFVNTYGGSSATTEDFKSIVEKHMTVDMERIGNGKMDWFFDEYVYGTALPTYNLESSFDKDPASGDVMLNFKVTQSNVTGSFRMLVPVYLELANGQIAFLGRVPLTGNDSNGGKVALRGVKATPRRAMLNYYDDVLASPN